MSADQIGMSILLLGVACLVGKWIRTRISLLQKLFIPASLITGVMLLLLGDEVLGSLIAFMGFQDSWLSKGLIPEHVQEVWGTLPELLISVIFASLFLGKEIPAVKKIWEFAGPQLAFGQTLAWGQYVLGILLAILVLVPFFDMPPEAGALIEISFEGGHGTAAGLAGTFSEVEFEDGKDLALGLATVSMLSGVIICILLVNWGVRTNKVKHVQTPNEMTDTELKGIMMSEDEQPSAGKLPTKPESIEPLTLHFGFIAASILIGYLLLEGLILLEQWTWGRYTDMELMTYVPLFTFAMIGSVIIQLVLQKIGRQWLISRGLIVRIQGLALDLLIVSALGTLSLAVIGDNLIPFLLMAAVGLGWSVFMFLVLAPRMLPEYWFERGMSDLGQALGMTATGLLMLRIVDGNNRTRSVESFGYKQLLFEPILGGGLFTALAMPFIYQFGPIAVLILTGLLTAGWLLLGLLYFGKKREAIHK